jgi:hypothetical protein
MKKLIEILLLALRACWQFIEDVPDDAPDRSERFFALRSQVRIAFAATDTPCAEPPTPDEIVEASRELIEASKLVVKRWESGNLAEAVTNLGMVSSMMEYTLDEAEKTSAATTATLVESAPTSGKKLTLKACIHDDYCDDFDHIVVNLAPGDITEIHRLARLARSIGCCKFGDKVSIFDKFGVDLFKVNEDGAFDEKGLELLVEPEDARVEAIRFHVEDDEFWWSGYIKHSEPITHWDNSRRLPLSILDSSDDYDERDYIGYGAAKVKTAEKGDYPCEGCRDINSDGEHCDNEDVCRAWQIYSDN